MFEAALTRDRKSVLLRRAMSRCCKFRFNQKRDAPLKIRTAHSTILTALTVGAASLLVTVTATAQDPLAPHSHPQTPFEFWSNVRALPAVVTSIEGDKVNWRFEEKKVIHAGTFLTDSLSTFKQDDGEEKTHAYFTRNHKQGYWVFVYCRVCKTVYHATHVPSSSRTQRSRMLIFSARG